jgi:DNA (cytosine-5)-methyltransferase 1
VAVRPETFNIISLCTGGGGLDLGVELAMPGARTVCVVEREAFAASHLVSAMQQGLLDEAPVWSNARTFNGRPWRGLVDGLIGGIPCQPHSLAGLRQGEDDERDLWSTARRIIVQSGCWFVLIENVGGMLSSGGAERVWRDLRRLGFDVEGGLFTASEVGAPHERERIIILAVADYADWRWDYAPVARECDRPERPPGGCSRELANSSCDGLDRRKEQNGEPLKSEQPTRRRRDTQRCDFDAGGQLADSDIQRLEGYRQSRECAREFPVGQGCGELDTRSAADIFEEFQRNGFMEHPARDGWREGRTKPELRSGRDSATFAGSLFPPGRSDLHSWRHTLERAPQLEPAFRRVADGLASRLDIARVDRLRLLGNGVVSLEGAYAFRTLATRLAASGSIAAKRLVRGMVMTDSEISEAAE